MEWMFKIDLKDPSVFDDYEREYEIEIPEELREFIKNYNSAAPEYSDVFVNEEERVYDKNLSFNPEEEEATTFTFAMKIIANPDYIPFAKDPFGNFFCYEWKSRTISYYFHEEEIIEDTDAGLQDFIASLH